MKKSFLAFGFGLLSLFSTFSHASVECEAAKTGHPCGNSGAVAQVNQGVGNPINLITGNKFQQEIDMHMRPSGLEIVRYYNSLYPADYSAIGSGWRLGFNSRLYKREDKWQILMDDGSRVMFSPPQGKVAVAKRFEMGQIILTDRGELQWITPEAVVRTYDAQGYLIQQLIPGYLPVNIERMATSGPQRELLKQVNGGTERLIYHYDSLDGNPRLVRISAPTGTFSYQYERPQGKPQYRITKVIRSDQWQRRYLYESEYQSDHPFLLTGIELVTPGQEVLRESTWAYNDQGLAVYTTVGQIDNLRIEYLQQPNSENAQGLTRVLDKAGNETLIKSTKKGGQLLIEEVSGYGCYLCPAVGTTARYDNQGRFIAINGYTIERDAQGKVAQITVPHQAWGPVQVQYDEQGRVTQWTSPSTGTTKKRYNTAGQLSNVEQANGTEIHYDYKNNQIAFKCERDAQGECHRTTVLVGDDRKKEVENEYSSVYMGNIRKHDNSFLHETTYRLAKGTFYDLKHDIGVNPDKRMSWLNIPERGQITFNYNPDFSLKEIIFEAHGGRTIPLVEITPDGLVFGNGLSLKPIEFNFKQYLFLSHKANSIWFQERQYSESGDLLVENTRARNHHESIRYLYDPAQRLIAALKTTQQSPAQEYYYAWNADGSNKGYKNDKTTIISSIQRDASGLPTQVGEKTLRYGSNNRIAQVSNANGGEIVSYLYSAEGFRISKTFKKHRKLFYYIGGQLVAEGIQELQKEVPARTEIKDYERRLPTYIKRRYIYARGLPVAFIDYAKGITNFIDPDTNEHLPPNRFQIFYIHTDHIGQPTMVTDHNRNVRWHATYSPTGKATILKADIEFNLRLPGQYYDEETGWHDNGFRTYDPDAGHYLEPDPVGPMEHNQPFGYANQQPRRYIDPLGLLLLAFDGTTNNTKSNTNVLKLFQLYEGPKFYKEGPGGIPSDNFLQDIGGVVFNTSYPKIFKEHKKNFLNYLLRVNSDSLQDIIPIDLIGFSRGAVTAMAFANMIVNNIKEDGVFSFEWYYYNLFGERIEKSVKACLDLRFIGLFDSVSMHGFLGWSNDKINYASTSKWNVIVHAVALNEYRDLLPLVTYQMERKQNVIEKPFMGNHSDLGGVHVPGDADDEHNPHPQNKYGDLSHIPLAWVHTQAKEIGVPFKDLREIESKNQYYNLRWVINPVVHGSSYRLKNKLDPSVQTDDRDLENPNSNERLSQQRHNALLGDKVRKQHAEVSEYQEKTFDWDAAYAALNPAYVDIFGQINAKKYIAWLEQEYNWTSPLIVE